jgi:hypothetical protein
MFGQIAKKFLSFKHCVAFYKKIFQNLSHAIGCCAAGPISQTGLLGGL